MEPHTCNINCFDNYTNAIRDRIERKLELHRVRDLTLHGSTIECECAMKLLRKSGGRCAICSCQLKLHDWRAYDPKQFSFDRLNDEISHCECNLQITCYECNIYKAARMYNKPVTDFSRAHKPHIRVEKKCFSDELC